MMTFDLPQSCVINKAVPKNAFHPHLTAAQRKALTAQVDKITWTHSLTPSTTNLSSADVTEIQIFHIALRQRDKLPALREAMEKVIPYTLLLWLEFDGEVLLSSSQKHSHALESDRSVIDWTFATDWFPRDDHPFNLQLVDSLDEVAKRLWIQLSGKSYDASAPVSRVVEDQQAHYRISREIAKVEARISRERQFNKKVELNRKLQSLKSDLARLS